MRKLIVSLCLICIATPSFAASIWDERAREPANRGVPPAPLAVNRVFKGQYYCLNCSSANNYDDYMWAALIKFKLVEGEYLHIYSPNSKTLVTVRLGRVMYENTTATGGVTAGVVATLGVGVTDPSRLKLIKAGAAVGGTHAGTYIIPTLVLEQKRAKAKFHVRTKVNPQRYNRTMRPPHWYLLDRYYLEPGCPRCN